MQQFSAKKLGNCDCKTQPRSVLGERRSCSMAAPALVSSTTTRLRWDSAGACRSESIRCEGVCAAAAVGAAVAHGSRKHYPAGGRMVEELA